MQARVGFVIGRLKASFGQKKHRPAFDQQTQAENYADCDNAELRGHEIPDEQAEREGEKTVKKTPPALRAALLESPVNLDAAIDEQKNRERDKQRRKRQVRAQKQDEPEQRRDDSGGVREPRAGFIRGTNYLDELKQPGCDQRDAEQRDDPAADKNRHEQNNQPERHHGKPERPALSQSLPVNPFHIYLQYWIKV